ncbi:pirin family protein [Arthrobacter sp. A5]|uniref:pirin family protein n=1 Tax=Arthrobacter sp. A5 TaxID=576926 RepID=UPI003DA9B67A
MSNLEAHPQETVCPPSDDEGPSVRLLPAREVPLGGIRAMTVSRTLPQRGLPTIGAWCFLDSYGPGSDAMTVLPHPHIGLQTVSWLLTGTIRHRDSLGSDVLVRPGELNLMTAGAGVAHSEFSVRPPKEDDDGTLRGLQLWVALPDRVRQQGPRFEQHSELPVLHGRNYAATVIIGSLGGAVSPALVHTPLLAADVSVGAAGEVSMPLDPGFEHAVLALDGALKIDGVPVSPGPLAHLGTGRSGLDAAAAEGARFLLIGGEPFEEELLMWWNFVGRNHDEIVRARQDWEDRSGRFPEVRGHGPDAKAEAGRIPAPPMPAVRLSPRRRCGS